MIPRLLAALALLCALGLAAVGALTARRAVRFEEHDRYAASVRRVAALDATLNEDVLKSRSGLLASYDVLAFNGREVARLLRELSQPPSFLGAPARESLQEPLWALTASSKKKALLIEAFKSTNAVVRNSVGFFPVAASELERRAGREGMVAPLSALTKSVLIFDLTPSETLAVQARKALDDLRHAPPCQGISQEDVEVVARHAEKILLEKPHVDALIREIVSLPVAADVQALDDAYRLAYEGARTAEARGRLAAFALALGTLLFAAAYVMAVMRASARALAGEKEKSERLLLNVLPRPIADRLKVKEEIIAESFDEATVLFADLVGFTGLSSRLSAPELVAMLNDIFSAFDRLAEKHGLEKIKTIGDAYMVVGGLPTPRADHACAMADMALGMLAEIERRGGANGRELRIRIGIHTGPVVAGVIGIRKFIYDLWGDTVNVASRMESHGAPGSAQVSEATAKALGDAFEVEDRGVIEVKGKGPMRTFWLKGRRAAAVKTA